MFLQSYICSYVDGWNIARVLLIGHVGGEVEQKRGSRSNLEILKVKVRSGSMASFDVLGVFNVNGAILTAFNVNGTVLGVFELDGAVLGVFSVDGASSVYSSSMTPSGVHSASMLPSSVRSTSMTRSSACSASMAHPRCVRA